MKHYNVISTTPAGRKRYLEILVPYILRNREHIQEHHFWLNTDVKEDRDYIFDLARQYPDFFKVNEKDCFEKKWLGFNIWQYFQDYVDEKTIYLRFDDDICFMNEDAVPNLIEYRIQHPKPFIVFGNIVNNAICTHIQQQRGILPAHWNKVKYECMDKEGWDNPQFAERLHKKFLCDLKKGNNDQWKFSQRTMGRYERFSINALAWLGKDMKDVRELSIKDLRESGIYHPVSGIKITDDEIMLSQYLPTVFKRPNDICGEALFGHFAYYTQRNYIDRATVLRQRYKNVLAGKSNIVSDVILSVWEAIKKIVYFCQILLSREFVESHVKIVIRKYLPLTYIGLRSIKRFIIKAKVSYGS